MGRTWGLASFWRVLPPAKTTPVGTRRADLTGDRLASQADMKDSGLRPFLEVRGSREILALSGALSRLTERSGQQSVMEHLRFLLSKCRLGAKVPHLLLRRDPTGEVESAVLLSEYRVGRVPTGVFLPVDFSDYQSVLAPEEMRSAVAGEAVAYLMRRRALVVLLSLRRGDFSALGGPGAGTFAWTTDSRVIVQTLPLKETLHATLAALGAHTRRNLRHFQRRAVTELGATFESRAELTKAEFLTMNRHTLYPAPEDVAACRLHTVRELAGSFMIGLRAGDGAWLSLVGGRRHAGVTTIEWQMNTSALPAYSLGTAMRMFLLEHEIAQGTRCLNFDGGTSHSMQRAFEPETVSDLLAVRTWLPLGLLRRTIPPRLPAGLQLSKMLLSQELVWRRAGRQVLD